jgi:uncharacterized membrane protein
LSWVTLVKKVHVHFLVWCILFSNVESLFGGKFEKWVIAMKATSVILSCILVFFFFFLDKSQKGILKLIFVHKGVT